MKIEDDEGREPRWGAERQAQKKAGDPVLAINQNGGGQD